MQKNSLIAVLLFLISSIAQAQGNKDELYITVDYCNCKLAYTYCEQFASKQKGSPEEKSFALIKPKLSCKIGNSPIYDTLITLLKRNNFEQYTIKTAPEFKKFKETLKSLNLEGFTKDQVIAVLLDGIFSNSKLKDVISSSGFSKQKEVLKTELEKYFDGKFPNNPPVVVATTSVGTETEDATKINIEDLQTQILELQKKVDENTTHWYSPNWIAILIAFLLVGIVFYIIVRVYNELNDKINKSLNESNSSTKSNINWNQNHSSSNNSRGWQDFKNNIERTVGDMTSAISKMQNTISLWELKNSPNQQPVLKQQKETPKQQRDEFFYASIPNTDSSFNNSSISEEINATESFYKFTLKDSNKASFEFLNDERAAKNASSSPELILYPVCKIKNSPSQNVKRIKTITPGIVVKRNDKWELDTPAVIEYE